VITETFLIWFTN